MNTNQVINSIMVKLKLTQADIARKLGWHPNQLSQRMLRSSVRGDELLMILEACGIRMTLTVNDTNEDILLLRKGHGHRLVGFADHVRYDTDKCDAVANNFYADGEHEFDENGEARELYMDTNGTYFFAEYYADPDKRDRIRMPRNDEAEEFKAKWENRVPPEKAKE